MVMQSLASGRTLGIAAIALFVTIVLAHSYFAISLDDVEAADARSDRWQLPAVQTAGQVNANLIAMRSSSIWGEMKPPASGGASAANRADAASSAGDWRLVGIINEGGDEYALFTSSGVQEVNRLKQGDELETLGTVQEIHHQAVVVNFEGEEKTLKLYD